MPARVTVRAARLGDVDVVARLLVEAFDESRLVRWLVPDTPADRRRCFAVWVEHAVEAGTGHVDVAVSGRTDRPLGVAVWWDGDTPVRPAGYLPGFVDAVPAVWADRFEALDASLARARPAGGFAHVALWAVRPPMQRREFGALLLKHVHAELDAAGFGAFQYATSAAGRDHLCKRYGYESAADPIPVGPHGFPVWALSRKPNPEGR